MLARLWWKEFRLFWPVWLFITFCALAAQWLAVWYLGDGAKSGLLMLHAVGWAFLYATAVSASAFAAEREQRTLRFLDTLPVARDFLWRSKASFAIVTTLALGMVLLLVAALSTDFSGKPTPFLPTVSWVSFFSCLVLLIETIGWGLFWSSILEGALSAAAMTVVAVGVVVPLMMRQADLNPSWWSDAVGYRLVIAALTTLASFLILTRKPRPSPPLRVVRRREAVVPEPRSITRRASSKPPRFWLNAARSLVWETFREMRRPLAIVAVAILVVPFFFIVSGVIDPVIAFLIGVFAAVAAGVNVFGAENQGKTYRFLAHHGVGPGVVWSVKVGLWSLAMIAVCFFAFALLAPRMTGVRSGGIPEAGLILLGIWTYGFSAGQLCGMVIRRGITAGLLAFVLMGLLLVPVWALISFGLVSGWEAVAIPLGLFVISRIWCVDWMQDRPGARPWIKLGLSVCGVFGLIFGGHVWNRINDIPALSPGIKADLLATTPTRPIDAAENAAPLYSEALGKLGSSDDASFNEAIDLIRRGSKLPYCRFPERELQEVPRLKYANISNSLNLLLTREIRGSLEKGALDKAWSDILTHLRMARHFQAGVSMKEAMYGLQAEIAAMALAVEWASDSRQTTASIERALKDLKALPTPPPAEEAIREEWALLRRIVALPKDQLRDIIEGGFLVQVGGTYFSRSGSSYKSLSAGILSLALSPWEIERAKRVIDELFAAKVLESRRDPWRRIMPAGILYNGWEHAYYLTPEATFYRYPGYFEWDLRSSPVVHVIYFPIDTYLRSAERTEAMRRGLLQFVALRAWQLKHDGNLPDELSEIVPGELEKLPVDPFSNKPFLYLRSRGEKIHPLNGFASNDDQRTYAHKAMGRRLLVSFGENRHFTSEYVGRDNDDIIFVLPAARNDPPVVPLIEEEFPKAGADLQSGMAGMMEAGMMKTKEAKPEEKKDEEDEPKM